MRRNGALGLVMVVKDGEMRESEGEREGGVKGKEVIGRGRGS